MGRRKGHSLETVGTPADSEQRRGGAYRGARIAMGTMHCKEQQVAPAFAEVLGAQVFAPVGLDTDQFGTFTGEVTRTLTPQAAALAKARLAMRTADVPYAIASEGSYHTWYATLAIHEEILVFLDDTRGIEIIEGVNTPGTPGAAQLVDDASAAIAAAHCFGFPDQGAAIKANINGQVRVVGKGITDDATLIATVHAALAAADTLQAWVEPDLRAHHNPSRRQVLTALARRLAQRLATACPACHCPGYGKVAVDTGLPCQACRCPTTLIAADIHGCAACEHRDRIARNAAAAEPRFCPQCNP